MTGLALPSFGRSAMAAPAEPMQFIGWQYQPEIVAENVGIFSKLYDENVNYELVPGEYHAVAETKLIGGQHIDMMYSEEDRLIRWNTISIRISATSWRCTRRSTRSS
jgi:multiple sugar transport system substrate-binding protein